MPIDETLYLEVVIDMEMNSCKCYRCGSAGTGCNKMDQTKTFLAR